MGGGYGQTALGLIPEFVRKRPDAVDLVEDFPGSLQDGLPGCGDSRQMFALAGKYLYPQFILKCAYLLADTWLGGVQGVGGLTDV